MNFKKSEIFSIWIPRRYRLVGAACPTEGRWRSSQWGRMAGSARVDSRSTKHALDDLKHQLINFWKNEFSMIFRKTHEFSKNLKIFRFRPSVSMSAALSKFWQGKPWKINDFAWFFMKKAWFWEVFRVWRPAESLPHGSPGPGTSFMMFLKILKFWKFLNRKFRHRIFQNMSTFQLKPRYVVI